MVALTVSGCPTNGALSCSSNAKGTCCFEAPGGLILQTQFWDTSPETGPTDSFTIHGLWPDNCDGSFSENCDSSRDYTGISSLLSAQGATTTLDFMNQFWLNDPDDGSNEELWEHEWATHGTCYSTLQVDCLPKGSAKGAEAVAFFEQVVTIFQLLLLICTFESITISRLTNQGITPSSSTTHTYKALTAALEAESGGFAPQLECDGSDLSEVYWYFNLRGSVIDGDFEQITSPFTGSCPSSGIKWLPKTKKN
ncbi:base non-specific and adenylic acid preferential ribonuclease [Gymnopus androsaceus JB14]|uniref:ribonuclease T2 n=1 Tax=Gymnopus androsaceus JB14 TaxID=1447944 RepID=A0A6A4I4H4_9AGAR|nr:base non-specific and adenylic acid preferential ribonuclease [Gymnopus androsaceus JB14]